MKKLLRLLIVLSALWVIFQPSRMAHAQSATSSLEYQSYLAHIAAASTSWHLHDTAAAKKWLASAPDNIAIGNGTISTARPSKVPRRFQVAPQ